MRFGGRLKRLCAGMGSLLELESLANTPFDGFLLSARHRQTPTLRWCVGTLQNAALREKEHTSDLFGKESAVISVWTVLR